MYGVLMSAIRAPGRRGCLRAAPVFGPGRSRRAAHRGTLAMKASSGTNSGAHTVPTPEARS